MSRANLPLPRELRDQVWGYLLLHEHVHAELYRDRPTGGIASEENRRHISRAHTFKFEVNVLATNRRIHEECSKVLNSNNFVMVSYKLPRIGVEKHIYSLPVVTENQAHCARFKGEYTSVLSILWSVTSH